MTRCCVSLYCSINAPNSSTLAQPLQRQAVSPSVAKQNIIRFPRRRSHPPNLSYRGDEQIGSISTSKRKNATPFLEKEPSHGRILNKARPKAPHETRENRKSEASPTARNALATVRIMVRGPVFRPTTCPWERRTL